VSDILTELRFPLIQAPMAGGPSTVALAVAVSDAGGMGFLASGYGPADRLREQIRAVRSATEAPFGVNIFMPACLNIDAAAVAEYLRRLAAEEARYGAKLAAARNDDEDWDAFLRVVHEERPAVVSFTFGCPTAGELLSLNEQGILTWVTITDPTEAVIAQERGANAVIVQGAEAGGHRGGFSDRIDNEPLSLLPLLRLTRAACELPMIAAGGIIDGAGVAAALSAGAAAAQMGTAFMLADEAATHPAHQARLATPAPTGLTRAFSGRQARGIINRFQAAYTPAAPAAYPEVHYATTPLRAAARDAGDADGFNLWAGQTHALVQRGPAAQIVRNVAADAHAAAVRATQRLATRELPTTDEVPTPPPHANGTSEA
jgi:nitronate monooxygenase